MIHDTKQDVRLVIGIPNLGQVSGPGAVFGLWLGFAILDASAEYLDIVPVLLDNPADVGFTHCHVAPFCVPLVEDIGQGAAADVRVACFEVNDFAFDPFGFYVQDERYAASAGAARVTTMVLLFCAGFWLAVVNWVTV